MEGLEREGREARRRDGRRRGFGSEVHGRQEGGRRKRREDRGIGGGLLGWREIVGGGRGRSTSSPRTQCEPTRFWALGKKWKWEMEKFAKEQQEQIVTHNVARTTLRKINPGGANSFFPNSEQNENQEFRGKGNEGAIPNSARDGRSFLQPAFFCTFT